MSIGAARDGLRVLWKSESASIVTLSNPSPLERVHIMCSDLAGKVEISRKKKRVDSCGMLQKIGVGSLPLALMTELIVTCRLAGARGQHYTG